MRRKKPMRHTVHTKHPRYDVSQYARGEGYVIQPVSETPPVTTTFYGRMYLDLDSDFKEPSHLRDVPDSVWQMGYLGEKSGRPHPLKYIDLSNTDSPTVEGYRDNPLRTLDNKGIKYEIKMVPTDHYFYLASDARKRYGASQTKERSEVNEALAMEYAEAMKDGSKFPLPYVDYDHGSQEGRHRVRALEILGVKYVPVMVIKEAKPHELPPQKWVTIRHKDGSGEYHLNPDYEVWAKEHNYSL